MTDTAVETPDAETVAEEPKPKKAPKEPTACACQLYSGQDAKGNELSTGCDEKTVRTFRPGHDAKLKSLFIKVAVAGNEVIKTDGDSVTSMQPFYAAEEYGFRDLVEASVNKATAKNEARAAKAKVREDAKAAAEAKRAEARAAREQRAEEKAAHAEAVAKAAEVAKSTPGPATAKIGRQKFDGEILADGTFKYKKGDKDVETTNFEVVIDPSTVTA